MKLKATATSTSLLDLIGWETLSPVWKADKPYEFEIVVWSWDSIFIETLWDEADTDSLEITSSFRFKTYSPENVFIIASTDTDFIINLVW